MNDTNSNPNHGFKFLYSGSFDPLTRGHLSLPISLLRKDPDAKIVILIAINPSKVSTFTLNERKFMIEKAIPAKYKDRIRIEIYEGLIPDYVYDQDIAYIIKGIRDAKDSDYEIDMANLSSEHFGEPITLLIPQTEPQLSNVSSTNLKVLSDVVGISLNKYATAFVRESLKMKKTGQLLIGVTGGISSGKSTLCKELLCFSQSQSVKIYHLNMDHISHIILEERDNSIPLYYRIRNELVEEFGDVIQKEDGTIDRKILGEIVFGDQKKLNTLTNVMLKPSLHLMSKKIRTLGPGIVLLESAILIDRNLTEIVDENIINVIVSEETQLQRMMNNRKLTLTQAERRLHSQLEQDTLLSKIKLNQEKEFDRLYLGIDADQDLDIPRIYETLKKEYLLRKEIIRFGNIIIPSKVTFQDDNIFVETVIKKYSEEHRKYHNLSHIEEMLVLMQELNHVLRNPFKNPVEVYLAIVFHDIVYDVSSKENEEKSAIFACEFLSSQLRNVNCDFEILNRLIYLTSLHGNIQLKEENLTEDEKLFLDIDMAILGANKDRLFEYEEGVYYEYSTQYSREDYLKGRRHFLEKLMTEDIYYSDYYRSKSESKAKSNIQSILDWLV